MTIITPDANAQDFLTAATVGRRILRAKRNLEADLASAAALAGALHANAEKLTSIPARQRAHVHADHVYKMNANHAHGIYARAIQEAGA